MKSMRLSQVWLSVGVTMGLVALYAGGAPMFGSGEAIIGGWYTFYPGDGTHTGCTSSSCGNCEYLTTAGCAEADGGLWGCQGGSISIAVAAPYPAPSTRSTGVVGCYGFGHYVDWCREYRAATCDAG
jgi:hypothetical protein